MGLFSKKKLQPSENTELMSTNEALKEELKKVQTVDTPKTRIVYLKYKSCCGCGCADVAVKRTVSHDSKLKTGTRISETQEGDTIDFDYDF